MNLTNNLWNVKYLPLPPLNTCQSSLKAVDVTIIKNVLLGAKQFFDEVERYFATEAQVISRFIYKMKLKFRSSKDFKAMEKLNRALRGYFEINLYGHLLGLMKMFPSNYTPSAKLPTKNVLDHFLVRIQSFGKLMCRILDTCQVTAVLMQQRLKLGHFWKTAFTIFASISRIYALTKDMTFFVCKVYSDLLSYSKKFSNVGVEWLPVDYKFPENLEEWLEIDWVKLDNTIIEIPDEEIPFFNLEEDSDDDVEFVDECWIVSDDDDGGKEREAAAPTYDWFVDSDDEKPKIGVKRKADETETAVECKKIKLDPIEAEEIINLDTTEDLGEEVIIHTETENIRKKKEKFKTARNSMGSVIILDDSQLSETTIGPEKTPKQVLEKLPQQIEKTPKKTPKQNLRKALKKTPKPTPKKAPKKTPKLTVKTRNNTPKMAPKKTVKTPKLTPKRALKKTPKQTLKTPKGTLERTPKNPPNSIPTQTPKNPPKKKGAQKQSPKLSTGKKKKKKPRIVNSTPNQDVSINMDFDASSILITPNSKKKRKRLSLMSPIVEENTPNPGLYVRSPAIQKTLKMQTKKRKKKITSFVESFITE